MGNTNSRWDMENKCLIDPSRRIIFLLENLKKDRNNLKYLGEELKYEEFLTFDRKENFQTFLENPEVFREIHHIILILSSNFFEKLKPVLMRNDFIKIIFLYNQNKENKIIK